MQMEQLLCARGYSDQIAGFASSSFLLSGCVASLPVSIVAAKMQRSLQTTKILMLIGSLGFVSMGYLFTIPDHPELLIMVCAITGVVTVR